MRLLHAWVSYSWVSHHTVWLVIGEGRVKYSGAFGVFRAFVLPDSVRTLFTEEVTYWKTSKCSRAKRNEGYACKGNGRDWHVKIHSRNHMKFSVTGKRGQRGNWKHSLVLHQIEMYMATQGLNLIVLVGGIPLRGLFKAAKWLKS